MFYLSVNLFFKIVIVSADSLVPVRVTYARVCVRVHMRVYLHVNMIVAKSAY